MRIPLVLTVTGLGIATWFCGSVSAQGYEVIEFDPVAPGFDLTPVSLNVHGQAVLRLDTPVLSRSYFWSQGVAQKLDAPARGSSDAGDLNDFGLVAGYEVNAGHPARAYTWRFGVKDYLPNFPGGATGFAFGLNNRGDVVGAANLGAGLPNLACLWRDGAIQALDIPPSSGIGDAIEINDFGDIVGFWPDGVGDIHAFRVHNGVFDGMGLESVESQAFAVNNGGAVVGWLQTASGERAFRYENGVLEQLPLISGHHGSRAEDVNDLGEIVGTTIPPGFIPRHGFLYRRGITYDLNDLIPPASGYTVQQAVSINNAGEIVALGTRSQGSYAALLLVPDSMRQAPPAPGAAARNNDLDVAGAAPGAPLQFFYGVQRGSTSLSGCPGLSLDIRSAALAGTAAADGFGHATLTVFTPASASGREVLLQAFDPASCTVSTRVAYRFP